MSPDQLGNQRYPVYKCQHLFSAETRVFHNVFQANRMEITETAQSNLLVWVDHPSEALKGLEEPLDSEVEALRDHHLVASKMGDHLDLGEALLGSATGVSIIPSDVVDVEEDREVLEVDGEVEVDLETAQEVPLAVEEVVVLRMAEALEAEEVKEGVGEVLVQVVA